ncbi:MAG: Desiccation/radiation resistance protein [Chlamydiae bacterium]|nr:Desiccation/radiation resistance protein [Chlamydiota bacterium]
MSKAICHHLGVNILPLELWIETLQMLELKEMARIKEVCKALLNVVTGEVYETQLRKNHHKYCDLSRRVWTLPLKRISVKVLYLLSSTCSPSSHPFINPKGSFRKEFSTFSHTPNSLIRNHQSALSMAIINEAGEIIVSTGYRIIVLSASMLVIREIEIETEGERRSSFLNTEMWNFLNIPHHLRISEFKQPPSAPAFDNDGNLVCCTSEGVVKVIDYKNKGILSSYDLQTIARSSVALFCDGIVCIGDTKGYLHFHDKTLTPFWKFNADSEIRATPIFDKYGNSYVSSIKGTVYALNHRKKKLLWSISLGANPFASLVVNKERLLHGSLLNGNLFYIDLKEDPEKITHHIYTTREEDTFLTPTPAINNKNHIFFSSRALSRFGSSDINMIEKQKSVSDNVTVLTEDMFQAAPVADHNGFVYLESSKRLYATNSRGESFSYSFSNNVISRVPLTIAADGDLICVSGDRVYKFHLYDRRRKK